MQGFDDLLCRLAGRFCAEMPPRSAAGSIRAELRGHSWPCATTELIRCRGLAGAYLKGGQRLFGALAGRLLDHRDPTGRDQRQLNRCVASTIGPVTATSANWKVIAQAWHTTRAPILISFSCRLVSDQSAMASGRSMERRKLARSQASACSCSRTSLSQNRLHDSRV
jgi:hypothetical protein